MIQIPILNFTTYINVNFQFYLGNAGFFFSDYCFKVLWQDKVASIYKTASIITSAYLFGY